MGVGVFFNISLTLRDSVTQTVSITQAFEERAEPRRGIEPMSSAYQPNTLPLGQIASEKNKKKHVLIC